MKAAQINNYGPANVVEIKEIDTPVAGAGQVLVQVHASSINPFDTVIREGYMKEMIPVSFPATLGGDIAGVVVTIGAEVDNFAVGDKVYGQANIVAGNSGAFAEFAATKASQIAAMPRRTDFDQAASLPLVGVSALQGIVDHLNVQAGQKLFIHGAAGGIGSMAVQIAKNIGAYVAATATGDGIDYVKDLGADLVIDYKAENFAEQLSDFDAVFELAGGKEFDKTLTILKRGGTAVSMIATADEAKAKELGVSAISQQTQVNTDRLNRLTKLIDDGVVTPQVEKVFALNDIQQAFEARESGAVKGKVVLHIQ